MTVGPVMYLAAAPKQPAVVPTLTRPRGVRDLLEEPPHSRYSGFNLLTLDRASIVGGNRLRVSNGTRKHIDLLADGTLTAVATFNEFLGWGRRDFFHDPKINGVAVVEFTYDFVLLYERLLAAHLDPRPNCVRFRIGLQDAIYTDDGGNESALYLSPGPIGDFALDEYRRKAAPSQAFSEDMDVSVADEEPYLDIASASYELIRRLYNWFGHTDDAIPYTSDDETAIDIEQIKALG